MKLKQLLIGKVKFKECAPGVGKNLFKFLGILFLAAFFHRLPLNLDRCQELLLPLLETLVIKIHHETREGFATFRFMDYLCK